MIKGIIFDFGGPILDGYHTKPLFEQKALHKGLEKDIFQPLIKDYFSGAHIAGYKTAEEFFAKTKIPLLITIEEFNDIMAESHRRMFIRPEMVELILKLKKNYKIALLSNYHAGLHEQLKEVFKIYHLFDVVISSHDIKIAKPDNRAYQIVLDKLGLQANETLFTDDKEENVEAARGMGIKGIVFQNSKQFMAELKTHLGVSDF